MARPPRPSPTDGATSQSIPTIGATFLSARAQLKYHNPMDPVTFEFMPRGRSSPGEKLPAMASQTRPRRRLSLPACGRPPLPQKVSYVDDQVSTDGV